MWPNNKITQLFGIDFPVIQAPMAGAQGVDLALAVAKAGGLGSLPCAAVKPDQLRSAVARFRKAGDRPINLNFWCHPAPKPDATREAKWRDQFAHHYDEFGIPRGFASSPLGLFPIDHEMCDVIEELRPEVVSFHFGLPSKSILKRVKATGAKVMSSATTVKEARFLEANGCDAVIAQGAEAGGHRGMFLETDVSRQVGTFSLLPQVVDAVRIPVIAAGGIADARGFAAALVLGASGVQIGSVYLRCRESEITPVHRKLLRSCRAEGTVITNVFTGRPARSIVNRVIREIGPMNSAVPGFPLAPSALAPLKAETKGKADFIPLWSGQSVALGRDVSAKIFTTELVEETLRHLGGFATAARTKQRK
jgi:nitronate monooxygenase